MLQRTYNWVMNLSAQPNAIWALAAISFIESSFFPIPPDILLIPMVLAARTKWLKIAFVCTLASVMGGIFGYGIGYYFYESIGRPLLDFYGYTAKFENFQLRYNTYGAWIVFIACVTPFPYKVITIASGLTHLDLATFTGASVLARGLRFFVVAALLWWIGPPIRNFIEKRLGLILSVFVILLIGGFFTIKFFF